MYRLLSSITCSVLRASSMDRIVLIFHSHTPPLCEAPGGFIDHWTSRCLSAASIVAWSHDFMDFFNSFLASTKFVPLSDLNNSGFPRYAMKHLRTWMNLSVSNEFATSMCTARIFRQTKMNPYSWHMIRKQVCLLFTGNSAMFLAQHSSLQTSPYFSSASNQQVLWSDA